MKKKGLIAGVLCALTLLAAGCGGAKDEKKSANGGEWKPKGAISIVIPAGAG